MTVDVLARSFTRLAPFTLSLPAAGRPPRELRGEPRVCARLTYVAPPRGLSHPSNASFRLLQEPR